MLGGKYINLLNLKVAMICLKVCMAREQGLAVIFLLSVLEILKPTFNKL